MQQQHLQIAVFAGAVKFIKVIITNVRQKRAEAKKGGPIK
jgi:hypothetical protein